MTTARRLIALLLLTLCPRQALAQAPPVASVRPVTDTYFGTQVTDPYRWMENLDDPAVKTWFKGQADFTEAQFARLPGRAPLLARIQSLDNANFRVPDVQAAGGRYFYRKAAPGDDNEKLYVREGQNGPERLLIDPQTLTRSGVHYSIDYFAPSPDGSLVAVGVSPGGSEASTMRLLKTSDGSEVGERIDRAENAAVSWADGRSFFYSRLQKLGPADPPTTKYQKGVAFRHAVGTGPEADTPVFGYGLSPQVPLALDDVPQVVAIPGSSYVFGVIVRGVQNENAVFYAPRQLVAGAGTPWRRLADFADDVAAVDEDDGLMGLAARGDDVYLLTHKDAPRYKIVHTSLKNPDLAHADVIVPASDLVIEAMAQAKDALYVNELDGGISRLLRVPYPDGPAEEVKLPYQGAIYGLVTDERQPGALFRQVGWTHPILWYAYDPKTNAITDTRLKPLPRIDMSAYTSLEVMTMSADGTMIPLSIVYKKGLALDGSNPTLLDGYGAYGRTNGPSFDPPRVAWLERGGVLAFAHVRGGGEYGEDWHRAGWKQTKPNTWHDFLACAQYLIDHKYTSPPRLAGSGTSAGGILISRSITERPDLFGAALICVGWSDMLRTELTPNGPSNVPEFGTFTTADGFKSLYEMDGYLHVKDGVKYPAVLLTTGINDPRVSPWEPAKMTARLQAATSSGKPVLLRVDYDAGHGFGSTKAQYDAEAADEYAFLLWQFGDPAFQPAAPGSAVNAVTPITVTGE